MYSAVLGIVPGSYPDGSILATNLGTNRQAASAVMVQIKVILVYNEKLYVTVNTAVKGEVSLLGINSVILGVINLYNHMVIRLKIICNVFAESRISAIMCQYGLSVKDNLCRCVYTVKLDINSLILIILGSREVLLIGAGAAIIIVAAILTVNVIPSVRNIYLCLCAVVITEEPVVIYKMLLAHMSLLVIKVKFSLPYSVYDHVTRQGDFYRVIIAH